MSDKSTKIIAVCLCSVFAACDSVASHQIKQCAESCALTGQQMARATDKECVCREPSRDGGAP